MCVSLIRSFYASGKVHMSHPSLKSRIQNRTHSIDRSLYFPRSPRSSSVWCSSSSSSSSNTGLNDARARLENYSTDSNLALNAKNTKWMLLSTKQMSRVHSLDSCTLIVNWEGDPLERVQFTKLHGLHIDQHLT